MNKLLRFFCLATFFSFVLFVAMAIHHIPCWWWYGGSCGQKHKKIVKNENLVILPPPPPTLSSQLGVYNNYCNHHSTPWLWNFGTHFTCLHEFFRFACEIPCKKREICSWFPHPTGWSVDRTIFPIFLLSTLHPRFSRKFSKVRFFLCKSYRDPLHQRASVRIFNIC